MYSKNEWHFLHYTKLRSEKDSLSNYQAIFLHFSVRFPLEQISESAAKILLGFTGLKGLFIQDEYDRVDRTKYWIKRLGFHIVFTAVPKESITKVYPPLEFPNTKFVHNLTGYAPTELNTVLNINTILPPSKRNIVIGYRGRKLPIKYGALGIDKIRIGKDVKRICELKKIKHDIEWDEHSRIHGQKWYEFLSSCKAMLGSESGSNVFDWDGSLTESISGYMRSHPGLSESQLYNVFIKPLECDGLMNQVSPRIFEMAAACTIMILYDGTYSGIIQPNVHYLSLNRDLSNLPHILSQLMNDDLIDKMALRARYDIVESGRFSYQSFIGMVDAELNTMFSTLTLSPGTALSANVKQTSIRGAPIKGKPPSFSGSNAWHIKILGRITFAIWAVLPMCLRILIKKITGRA
jgi:hypothetical protein